MLIYNTGKHVSYTCFYACSLFLMSFSFFFPLWPFNPASALLSRVIFFIVEGALLQLLMFHLFLILTLQCFFSSPSLSPLGLSSGPICSLVGTLPFSMNSILFMSSAQFSEVRLDSNHLGKKKFCSWGPREKREERMGLWGAWLSSATLHSISQNTMANK